MTLTTVSPTGTWAGVEEAIAALRAGRMIVLVDDPDRENEGDLVAAASLATPETVNFMATHGRGLICCPVERATLDRLDIPPMGHGDRFGTAFHVGVDHAAAGTGISASDRALAINALADPGSTPGDFRMPGHLFPLGCHPEGLWGRQGHTEASVHLVRSAGLPPAAVICEVAAADGEMARVPELAELAALHELPLVAISDVCGHMRQHEVMMERVTEAAMPLPEGRFRIVGYRNRSNGDEHVALVHGEVAGRDVPVRVHTECLHGDVFGSFACDCARQLRSAFRGIVAAGAGVVVYLREDADRAVGEDILADLGVRRAAVIAESAG